MIWKLVVVGLVLAAALWMAGGPSREAGFELTLLHTNDVHSHYEAGDDGLGGAGRMAHLIAATRLTAPHSLLLDAGDQFQGTLLFTVGGPSVVADVMNAMGYDAMALGNHEFDLGPASLADFLERAEFPILGANVDASADASLDGDIRPFDVFLFDGEIVAVFGLTTETAATASSPGPDVVFEPIVHRAQILVRVLERQGVNKIIALTHLGYAQDLALAAAVAGIDVIVGGHSHTALGDDVATPYPTWATSSDGEPVLVVTDGEWGKTLGRLDIVFDAAGRIVGATGGPVPITDDVPSVAEVDALVAPYAALADALLGQPVGVSDVDLDGDRSRTRSEETNLGNAIADAILRKAAPLGASVSIQNGGGIRASIPAGPVTMGQVLEVLPFGNEVTVVTLSGSDLRAALENGVSQVETGGGRFPQVAGVRFRYGAAAADGTRVSTIELRDPGTGQYRALRADDEVVVATNDFLAGGGDGYSALAGGAERYDTGWLVSDAFAEYLKAESPLHVEVEGRIARASPEAS